jgi:hypothetical protein
MGENAERVHDSFFPPAKLIRANNMEQSKIEIVVMGAIFHLGLKNIEVVQPV